MGKQKKALETSLDYGEGLKLKEAIKSKCKEYMSAVQEKFRDDYDKSIMMSAEDTQTKNEILRRIQYQKMKKAKLPNFIRIERERILQQREIEQRQILMNQSQTTLDDSQAYATDAQISGGSPKRSQARQTADAFESTNGDTTPQRRDTTVLNTTHASQRSLT